MKTPCCLLALALAATACQPQSASKPAKAKTLAEAPVVAPIPASASADTTAAVLELLQNVDLAPALANATDTANHYQRQPMEGFFGPDHYRISFFFTQVRRDSLRPQVFHVRGLDRYKKVITPFAGTCTLTRLAPLPDTVALENSQHVRAYTAFGTFELREDPATKGAGVYSGRALVDFAVGPDNKARLANFMDMDAGYDNPTKGGGLVFQGRWQNNKTGQRKPVAWARSYEVIVPEVLQKMGLGQRGDEVHPELAKYGWNEVWENDEWWAKSPKPSLSL